MTERFPEAAARIRPQTEITTNSPLLPYDRVRIGKLFDDLQTVRDAQSSPGKASRIDSLVAHEAVRKLALSPNDSLLDLGCGVGRVLLAQASSIRWGYGIDVSRISVELAQRKAEEACARNLLFGVGAIESPCEEINVAAAGVNKMLLLWSLHHLPDELKRTALSELVRILRRPGRIIIGDILFFEPPEKHELIWERVGYDGGITDRPSTPYFLKDILTRLGGDVEVIRLHPLAGVVVGLFSGKE